MSFGKFFILICFTTLSTVESCAVGRADSLYEILKIKTSGNYYIIQAKRNDSLFKIVSEKVELKETHLEMLKKGGYYSFVFANGNDTPKTEPLVGHASYLHVKRSRFWGDTKIKFTKRFHYRLYTTKNLIGLYYSQ